MEGFSNKMKTAWDLARQNIKKAQTRQKKCHDKFAKRPGFHVGDRVLLYHPKDTKGPLRKLALPNKGPYIISEITETNVFVVPEDQPKSAARCVAWNRIRHCPANLAKENSSEESESEDAHPEDESAATAPTPWKDRLRPRVRTIFLTRTSRLERGRCNTLIDPPLDHGPTLWLHSLSLSARPLVSMATPGTYPEI